MPPQHTGNMFNNNHMMISDPAQQQHPVGGMDYPNQFGGGTHFQQPQYMNPPQMQGFMQPSPQQIPMNIPRKMKLGATQS